MSSLKSHFRHPPPQHEATTQLPKYTSRIPTKPDVAAESGKSSKAAQHVSRLARKASKSLTSQNTTVKGSTTRTAVPATAVAQSAVVSGGKSSVTHYSGVASLSTEPLNVRTPSLVSGSSVSTYDSPRSALRRKPSGAIDRYAAQRRGDTGDAVDDGKDHVQSSKHSNSEMLDDTIFGISLPAPTAFEGLSSLTEVPMHSYDKNITRDFTPPAVSSYAPSSTPSTRYTDSPFSHAPTPSSMSSYTSSIAATSSNVLHARDCNSPAAQKMPPPSVRMVSKNDVSRSGLPPVRESSTSSSNVTVRSGMKHGTATKEAQARSSQGQNSKMTPGPSDLSTSGSETQALSSRARRPVQRPPELAHLNAVQLSRKSSTTQKSPPPARPTRDGTSSISDANKPSPIVQSDLPRLYTTYHKRTPSQDTPASSSSPTLKARFGFTSRSSSRNESPRIDSAVSPPTAAHQLNRGTTPELAQGEPNKLRRKDSPVVKSPAKSPRFGLFSRKSSKTEAPQVLQKPSRRSSKGPAAGTGHEGYGRFGARRSGSMSSNGGFRSPSTDSVSSSIARPQPSRKSSKSSTGSREDPEMDDFFRQRLTPVVLRGSGTGSMVSNPISSSDLPGASLHPNSSKSSSLVDAAQPRLLPSAIPAYQSGSPVKRPHMGLARKFSDSSEDDTTSRFSNLATRRSLTRMSSMGNRSPVRVPSAIITNSQPQQPCAESSDPDITRHHTDSSLQPSDDSFHGREGLWLRSPSPEPAVQRSRKWNFMQRSTASPRSKGKGKVTNAQSGGSHAASQSPYRGVAHYATLEPLHHIALEEAERIAYEDDTSAAEDSMSESNAPPLMVPYEGRHESLLPSPPKRDHDRYTNLRAETAPPRITVDRQDSGTPELLHAQTALTHQSAHVVDIPRSPVDQQNGTFTLLLENRAIVKTPEPMQDAFEASNANANANASPRQPRLSPVGRIPAVISRRDRDRKLSNNSFSRPFAHSQPRPSVKPPGSVYKQIRGMAPPIESSSQPVSSTSTRSDANSAGPKSSNYTNPPSASTTRTSMDIYLNDEFLAFPKRKDSEQSGSTNSLNGSYVTAQYYGLPQQDDIWNEYNDFVDEILTAKTPTTGSSLGAPFQHSNMLFGNQSSSWSIPPSVGRPPSSQLPLPPIANIPPPVLSVAEQISRFLQPSMSPITPKAISDFVGGYRSSNDLRTDNSEIGSAQHTGHPEARASVTSSCDSQGSSHSKSASLPETDVYRSRSATAQKARQTRDSQLVDSAEMRSTGKSSAHMRVGALMTSKWLSFGRVLFSPAHNGMQVADDPKVLVIDGLSSDWSYYVALSYPSAGVYNLTASAPTSPSFSWPDANEKPPANHKQIRLASIETPFPFPKGFFTAVVFRFPTATTEQAYTACISECKRVLRPGGYLEVAVLDLDLDNMGTRARKAVRGLKTRMQLCNEEVSLRNLSDVLVRLIGRRNFETVQRCIVGVPAAGRIPRSQDISSVSSGSSSKPIWRRETPTGCETQEFNFSHLLEDARNDQFESGTNNDENITKMVAKVGRWWYSTCYEKALLPSGLSIWKDPALLRECEKQGTSFRLLICHAQKPTQPRRRTVSV